MPPIESISRRRPVAAMPIGMSCTTGCASTVMALILLGRRWLQEHQKQRFGRGKGCTKAANDARPRFRGTFGASNPDRRGPVAALFPVAPAAGGEGLDERIIRDLT